MKEMKDLREELCIIVPFLIFALILFLGSFQYKFESRTVPMLIGGLAILLSGMRLFHIIFPKSKIGRFGEAGLAGEFDTLREEIEKETLKDHYEEPLTKPITFRDEKKAFIALLGGSLALFLLGYFIGGFVLIVGTSYYYGFKKKLPLLVTLGMMFLIVYILLVKVLDSPMYHGVLFERILGFFNLI